MSEIDTNEKILIVEDDFANQQVATLFLRKFGFECEIAENGQQAVEKANQKKYPIIFMDCQMPVMDGYDATRNIREDSKFNRKTPIIALTANILAGAATQCKDCGMDDILNKPVKMQAMQDMAQKWYKQNSKAV